MINEGQRLDEESVDSHDALRVAVRHHDAGFAMHSSDRLALMRA